jgi:hypothetical protein
MSSKSGDDWGRLMRGKTLLTADPDEIAAKVRRADARRRARGKKIDKDQPVDVEVKRDSSSTTAARP